MKKPKDNQHRPEVFIDWNTVDKYLQAGASGKTVADKIGIHENTLYLRTMKEKKMNFTEYRRQQFEHGNDNIHMKQYAKAMSGDNTLLIWLGKQRLGQRDKTETDTNIKLNGGVSIFEQMQKENESENTDKAKSE